MENLLSVLGDGYRYVLIERSNMIRSTFIPLFVAFSFGTPSQLLADVVTGFYLSDTSADLYLLNSTTGDATLIGNMGTTMNDIAASSDGRLFGVSSTSLFEINPGNASVTSIGSLGISLASGLEFSPNGTLFLSDAPTANSGNLYTVDTSSGNASLVGAIGFASNGDLAFDDTGRLFMTATNFTTEFDLIEVDPLNGNGTLIGAHGFGSLAAMDFDDTVLVGVNMIGQVIELDRTTGAGSLISTTSPALSAAGLTYAIAVPEPSAFMLLGILSTCLFVRCRKR